MARPFIFNLPGLTGGLNETAPEMIQDSESAQLDNWYIEGPSVWTRFGHTLLGGAHTEEILSIFLYDPDPTVSSDEIILLGCRSSLAKLSGSSIVPLTIADGRVYPASDNRWWFIQYGDAVFACQKANGGVKRIFGSSALEAGMSRPTVAPDVDDGGDGKKEPGVYRTAYRYYNTQTGARSNWSPFSREIELPEGRAILMTEIGTSSNPQVNARQIGATKADQAVMYLVGQINDNSTTRFEENASDAFQEYGEADVDVNANPITDTRHGRPPDQAWALELYKERLFVLNRDGLLWSEPGLMQSFKASSFLPVSRGTGLIHWEQHGLVIGTEKNAQILEGDTPDDFQTDTGNLSKRHGCPAGKSLAVGDKILFWYTGTNIVATAGGAPEILPQIERVRATLDSIPDAQKGDVVGETVPSKGWYVLSVPTDTVRKLIVYNYKESKFVGVFPSAPKTLSALLLENATEEALYAAFDDDYNLYQYLSGATDSGAAITSTLRTKNFGQENHAVQKVTRRVNVLCPQTNGTITLRVYHDGTLVEERTGLSVNKAGWKRFNMNTAGQPGHLVQIGLEYAGSSQLRIEQMQVEGTLIHGRRPTPA